MDIDCKKEKKKNTKKSLSNHITKVEDNIENVKDLNAYDLYLNRAFPSIDKVLSENLDIMEMHENLIYKFDFERIHKIRILKDVIQFEKNKLKKPIYKIELKNILQNISKMEYEIQQLQNNKNKTEYIQRTANLLDIFQMMGHKKKVISFNTNKLNKKDDIIHNQYRKIIIEKYIDIYNKYHETTLIYPFNNKTICQVCKLDLSKYISEDIGIIVCPKCNTEKTSMLQTCIISDIKFNNCKDGYEDRENFWKALQRFQGKQNNHIPERLYKELDEYFKSFGLPSGEEICKMEMTKKGVRGNTSRSMMFKALSETNNSVFYEDVNLICHLYWGWLLPDISADEQQIMMDYDMTQEVFKKIPKDRSSSLNAQYRLWQHLRIRGYKYPIDDFKIVKTPDILVEHDRIMKIMCDECKLIFIPAL